MKNPGGRFFLDLIPLHTLEFDFTASILDLVDSSQDRIHCPECDRAHDPQYRFCMECGAVLPRPSVEVDTDPSEPTGKAWGIEPDPDSRDSEPVYTGGGGAQPDSETSRSSELPMYKMDEDGYKPAPGRPGSNEPNPSRVRSAIIFSMIITVILPPIGVAICIAWAFMPHYRRAILPVFAACILGLGLWGWALWKDMASGSYDKPYEVAVEYIESQDWAYENAGHYYPLMELKRRGFMELDFPGESDFEFELIEHVLGPTGYTVEIKPGDEEQDLLKLQSLWFDQSGSIHLGSIDGPLFEPH